MAGQAPKHRYSYDRVARELVFAIRALLAVETAIEAGDLEAAKAHIVAAKIMSMPVAKALKKLHPPRRNS